MASWRHSPAWTRTALRASLAGGSGREQHNGERKKENRRNANHKTQRKIMNNKFDELAKGLAQSVTRRGALKKFSVGLAGMALACFALAKKAEADPDCLGCCGQNCHTGMQKKNQYYQSG